MKRRGRLERLSNRRTLRYDELSDGITVAQVTAVWSRSPATVCPTEAGLICSVTPSIFPGCPYLSGHPPPQADFTPPQHYSVDEYAGANEQ